MSRLFRRRRQEDFDTDRVTDTNTLARNAVSSVRQRLFEDPEFGKTFVGLIRKAELEQEAVARDESMAFTDAYGNPTSPDLSDKMHAARGQAFLSIIAIFNSLAEDLGDPDIKNDFDPEVMLNRIRAVIGDLTHEVYFQAQVEPPIELKNGAIGIAYEGLGTVVVWERIRGLENALDHIPLPEE